MTTTTNNPEFWKRKLAAYLHDPPEKVLDLAWHKRRAEDYEKGLALGDPEFARDCDHTAAAADRLPWPRWQFLDSAFDGKANHFKHPLGGGAKFEILPYPTADLAHYFASLNRPELAQGDERAQFFAFWRMWRWWAADHKDSRLAFLPADTRLPHHTIWVHDSIVSALQACVVGEGRHAQCRPAFLLFHIGPIQEYIAQARRTLDLWSGSYLLSYLIGIGLKYVALNFGPDCVIYPNLCGQPIFDLLTKEEIWDQASVHNPHSGSNQTLWDSFGYGSTYGRQRLLTPSLPNRFLAVLPANQATKVANEVEKSIRSTYKEVAETVWLWAAEKLKSAECWTPENKKRFNEQNDRFLEIAWQVLEWPLHPKKALELTAILPRTTDYDPEAGLRTILNIAKRQPLNHRDVRNFECERYSEGTRNPEGQDISGWKDPSKLQPDAELDNPGAAWSALYQLVNWQLDAVRQTRAWKAWSDGGWKVGRPQNKDSLNGKEEAILDLRGPMFNEEKVELINKESGVDNLFKSGELMGASTLIKRLWPTAWLQVKHGFKQGDWRMPDTRHVAKGQPFARSEGDKQFDADNDVSEDDAPNKYFAVLALDGDEIGKWVSGIHPKMPTLGEQLSDYIDPVDRKRKGAKLYFENNNMEDVLARKSPLNPSFHLQFSEMLANFSNSCARRIVEAFDGRLIYAGGDDVLALLPAHQTIPCAQALRAAFRGDPTILNSLTGAWHYANGRSEKIPCRLFDFDQPGFIKLSQDALCMEGEPKKFHAMVPGPAADCSVGIAIAHFKHPLQDAVRQARDAQKRAKTRLGRSAVALTLIKRSGETIHWGCKWDSAGLQAYTEIMNALQNQIVSAKFPYRIIEFVSKYQTTDSSALGIIKPADGFDQVALQILEKDIGIAAERQRGPNFEPQAVAKVTDTIMVYLKHESLGTAQQKIAALIGLCQTVAFIARNMAESVYEISDSESATRQLAERQPSYEQR